VTDAHRRPPLRAWVQTPPMLPSSRWVTMWLASDAAGGAAGRRLARNADAPMHQSREAHHSARPHHSPKGPTWPTSCVSRLHVPLPRSGSRRAATGAGRDPQTCRQTVMDGDTDSAGYGPPTWRFSRRFTGLNTPEFRLDTRRADLARRKQGVKSPHLHPHNQQVRASSVSHRRRSPRSWAALGPRTPMEGSSTSAWERLPKLVDRQSNPSLDWVSDLHSLAAHRPC
jgi:hypothetical protein